MEKKPRIVFDDSVKSEVIEALGFKVDNSSKLTDAKGKLATSQDFESINLEEFGGMLQGSKIPIKKNDSELIKYFISRKV